MRLTNFSRGDIRRVCGAMVVSLAVWLGHSPAAEASITVRLQQVDAGGNPVSSVLATDSAQTLVYADLIVSGNGSPLPITDLYSFATVLTWSTSSSGVAVADLYTVNASGTPVISAAAMLANEPGFLFADVDDQPDAVMNTTGLLANSQRYAVVDNFDFNPTLLDPTADTVIARFRFAVAEGIDDAVFSFELANETPNYGFLNMNNDTFSFTNGGGTIAVVPEPGTMQACILGIAVVGGNLLRRQVRRRQQGGQPALA